MGVIGSGGLIVLSAVAEAVLSLLARQPMTFVFLVVSIVAMFFLVYVVFACVVFWYLASSIFF